MANQTEFMTAIYEALPAAVPVTSETAAGAPQGKGAYALVITLCALVEFSYRGAIGRLPAGRYVYAGNAWGPGGIGARLRRHFRREKKLHWHVDQLTVAADSLHAFAIEGGTECDIIARLSLFPGFHHPLARFGSSDCAACPSHLLACYP